ncbi:MAG: DUF4886 domain-containing protein [Lachnospiraceae bacterium]|nr:DUF4886 domain-containing protein [Lachnospiraceae bacterium]
MSKKTYIPTELKSAVKNGVLVSSDDVMDYENNKRQSDINGIAIENQSDISSIQEDMETMGGRISAVETAIEQGLPDGSSIGYDTVPTSGSNKIMTSDSIYNAIVDNLSTEATNKMLSANQGHILGEKVADIKEQLSVEKELTPDVYNKCYVYALAKDYSLYGKNDARNYKTLVFDLSELEVSSGDTIKITVSTTTTTAPRVKLGLWIKSELDLEGVLTDVASSSSGEFYNLTENSVSYEEITDDSSNNYFNRTAFTVISEVPADAKYLVLTKALNDSVKVYNESVDAVEELKTITSTINEQYDQIIHKIIEPYKCTISDIYQFDGRSAEQNFGHWQIYSDSIGNTVGSPITENINVSQMFAICFKPIKVYAGDTIIVRTKGRVAECAWGLTDDNYVVKQVAPQGADYTEVPYVGTVAQDGYLLLNHSLSSRATTGIIPYSDTDIIYATKGYFASIKDTYTKEEVDSKTGKRSIRILSLGNSYSVDAFAYLPSLMSKIHPEIDLSFTLLWGGMTSIQNHYTFITTNQGSYTKHIFVNGNWTTTTGIKLSSYDFSGYDLLILHQFSKMGDDYNTIIPATGTNYLNELIGEIKNRGFTGQIGWMITPAFTDKLPYTSNLGNYGNAHFDLLAEVTKRIVEYNENNNIKISIVIPCGTALQFARSIIDDFTNIDYEQGVTAEFATFLGRGIGAPVPDTPVEHLRTGIGNFIESYAAVLALFGEGDSYKFTEEELKFVNSEFRGTTPEGINYNNQLLARKCAELAVRDPFHKFTEEVTYKWERQNYDLSINDHTIPTISGYYLSPSTKYSASSNYYIKGIPVVGGEKWKINLNGVSILQGNVAVYGFTSASDLNTDISSSSSGLFGVNGIYWTGHQNYKSEYEFTIPSNAKFLIISLHPNIDYSKIEIYKSVVSTDIEPDIDISEIEDSVQELKEEVKNINSSISTLKKDLYIEQETDLIPLRSIDDYAIDNSVSNVSSAANLTLKIYKLTGDVTIEKEWHNQMQGSRKLYAYGTVENIDEILGYPEEQLIAFLNSITIIKSTANIHYESSNNTITYNINGSPGNLLLVSTYKNQGLWEYIRVITRRDVFAFDNINWDALSNINRDKKNLTVEKYSEYITNISEQQPCIKVTYDKGDGRKFSFTFGRRNSNFNHQIGILKIEGINLYTNSTFTIDSQLSSDMIGPVGIEYNSFSRWVGGAHGITDIMEVGGNDYNRIADSSVTQEWSLLMDGKVIMDNTNFATVKDGDLSSCNVVQFKVKNQLIAPTLATFSNTVSSASDLSLCPVADEYVEYSIIKDSLYIKLTHDYSPYNNHVGAIINRYYGMQSCFSPGYIKTVNGFSDSNFIEDNAANIAYTTRTKTLYPSFSSIIRKNENGWIEEMQLDTTEGTNTSSVYENIGDHSLLSSSGPVIVVGGGKRYHNLIYDNFQIPTGLKYTWRGIYKYSKETDLKDEILWQ